MYMEYDPINNSSTMNIIFCVRYLLFLSVFLKFSNAIKLLFVNYVSPSYAIYESCLRGNIHYNYLIKPCFASHNKYLVTINGAKKCDRNCKKIDRRLVVWIRWDLFDHNKVSIENVLVVDLINQLTYFVDLIFSIIPLFFLNQCYCIVTQLLPFCIPTSVAQILHQIRYVFNIDCFILDHFIRNCF